MKNEDIAKLSEQVDRKFIETYSIDDYEILTDDGWKDISQIGKTVEYKIWEVKTKNHELKCADTHIVFDEGMNEVFVKDLVVGQMIQTDDGLEEVLSVVELDEADNMYDIQVDSEDHRYFTNGILSHNSTMYCIYALWLTTFWPEKIILLLANKMATALDLLSRIAMAYQYMPKWIKSACLEFNKSSITFANLSAIKAFASSSDAARGQRANVLILDEFAFLQKNLADKLFTSMYPVVSSSKNGKVIIVSTPNGTGNLYYDIWQQANSKEAGKNLDGWKPFAMWWWQVPGHDEKWKQQQIAAIGKERFAQEFNNEFLASSTNKKLIPEEVIEKHRIALSEMKALDSEMYYGKTQRVMNEAQDKVYEFTMWHEFDPRKTYLASGDCAEGIGGDSSVLYVWDVTDLGNVIQCAKFSSNVVSIVEFAFITAKILALYNNPYYICERNGVGSGYLDALKITYNYQHIVKEGKGGESGVFSHVTTKSKACLWAREMATTSGFDWKIHDKELLNDFDVFCKKDTSGVHQIYCAVPPAHDDHAMAWVWACWVLQPDVVERYFVCCQTFTSQLDKVYPKILQPLKDYTSEDIGRVINDPLHKQFLEFKDEICHKLGKAVVEERKEREADVFQRPRFQQDPYFGDYGLEPSWNGTQSDYVQPTMLGNSPMFYLP